MDNIFTDSKWDKVPTNDNIHTELVKSLGGDFFAVVDASFLLPLFSSWRNADENEEKSRREVFLEEFNLALDRAVKRRQLKEPAQTKQVYSKHLRKMITIPLN